MSRQKNPYGVDNPEDINPTELRERLDREEQLQQAGYPEEGCIWFLLILAFCGGIFLLPVLGC